MKKRIFSAFLAVLMVMNTLSASVSGDAISSGDVSQTLETDADSVQQEENNMETEQEDVQTEGTVQAESASEEKEISFPAISSVQNVTFTQENKTVSMDIEAEEGAFEEGTNISVSEAGQSDAVDAAVDAVRGSGKLSFLADEFDITPLLNGEKVQPNGEVTLIFGYTDLNSILLQANDYLIEQILEMLAVDPEDTETYAEYEEYFKAYIEENDLAITNADLIADVYHITDAGNAEKLTSTTPETC